MPKKTKLYEVTYAWISEEVYRVRAKNAGEAKARALGKGKLTDSARLRSRLSAE